MASLDDFKQSNDPRHMVSAEIKLGGQSAPLDVTVKEVIVGESLLNPSIHCAVTLQSAIYNLGQVKDWDQYKGQSMSLEITDDKYNLDNPRRMIINQTIYRCDNRQFSNLNTGQVEDLTLHTIDNSVLEDARTIITQSWQCTTPSSIVQQALQKVGAKGRVDGAGPAKDYVAENLHPFQVIQQQTNMALYNGDDPSFLHYMTFNEQTGENIHNFQALGRLIKQTAGYQIYASDPVVEKSSFASAFNVAITYNFPCDYDLLSDILNGIGPNGENNNRLNTFNMASGVFNAVGAAFSEKGANIFQSMTNLGTSKQHNSCDSKVEDWLLKRQARMGLLEKDKIAFRVTVPWSPWLHVGNVFHFHWGNRYDDNTQVYGTGDYLIVNLTHNIQFGGYAVTTLDCITNTYGS